MFTLHGCAYAVANLFANFFNSLPPPKTEPVFAPSATFLAAASPAATPPPLPLPTPRSQASKIEISSDKYRVGMPPVRPLPLENSCDVADVCSPDVLDELYEKVADILRAHDIDLTKPPKVDNNFDNLGDSAWDSPSEDDTEGPISLVYRSYPNVPESARLTLVVIAHWTNSPEAWELAVQAIRPVVLEYLRTQQEVDVEMIDEDHFDSLFVSLGGNDPEVAQNWDGVLVQIVDVLQNNPASRDTTLSAMVCRAGRTKSSEDPITMYVAVGDDCAQADWPPIIADIKKIIEPYHMELIFEHNAWESLGLFD